MKHKLSLFLLSFTFCLIPFAFFLSHADWPMVAATPERTSWCSEEVQDAQISWYRVIEPYIQTKVQLILANDMVFAATSKGLYAFDAATGEQKWVFPTELPLGNSPTVVNSVAYVGGMDKKLYAIAVNNGHKLWSYDGAEAGYCTNPLIKDNVVYLGNRDGCMYAIYSNDHAQKGQLKWKYKTNGPIFESAAYKNNTVFFASDDSYAYALNATTGAEVWKKVLPSPGGFKCFWPVIAGDKIFFTLHRDYGWSDGAEGHYMKYDEGHYLTGSGDTRDGTDVMQFFEAKPWRRTRILLDIATGNEITYDFDSDGKPEYPPFVYLGTLDGPPYPPVMGSDGRAYTFNQTNSSGRGDACGWAIGTQSVYCPSTDVWQGDEPCAMSAGGNVVYMNQICDRGARGVDVGTKQVRGYFGEGISNAPGYNDLSPHTGMAGLYKTFMGIVGGINGVHGYHGTDQNPLIPYKGKIYTHRSNCILCFAPSGSGNKLAMATTAEAAHKPVPIEMSILTQRLETEIQKILNTGHLRAGRGQNGHFISWMQNGGLNLYGDDFGQYWINPAWTILYLTMALPYVNPTMQADLRAYIQKEFADYSPGDYTSIGFSVGASREPYEYPPETVEWLSNQGPRGGNGNSYFEGWTSQPGGYWRWTPYSFCAMWKYVEAGLGDAKTIFDSYNYRLTAPPTDDIFAKHPFAHNAWIMGHYGYMMLEKLAGYTTNITQSSKYATYTGLLAKRAANFDKDIPISGPDVQSPFRWLAVCRNFLYLCPEVGQYLRDHAWGKVREAFDEYEKVNPYWFMQNTSSSFDEGTMYHNLDYDALFLAKAYVFADSMQELAKYLDVPSVPRGDLTYIRNLVLTIEAGEPHFVGPFHMQVAYGQIFRRKVQYVVPQSSQVSIQYLKTPTWVNALGDSLIGQAPATIGTVDTVVSVLLINSQPVDTMVTVITVVDPAMVMPKQPYLRLGNVLSITGIASRHQSIQFHITANQEVPFSLSVYNIKGQRLWHYQAQKPSGSITAIDWNREGKPTANITYLSVLRQSSRSVYQRFTIVK